MFCLQLCFEEKVGAWIDFCQLKNVVEQDGATYRADVDNSEKDSFVFSIAQFENVEFYPKFSKCLWVKTPPLHLISRSIPTPPNLLLKEKMVIMSCYMLVPIILVSRLLVLFTSHMLYIFPCLYVSEFFSTHVH